MQTTATNQNSQKSTSETAQKSLHGDKPQSGASAAHQKQKTPDSALQRVSDDGGQKQAQPQAQQRIRPEGMSRSQWKNFKNMRRVLGFWPELFNLTSPKPLKTGVLSDIERDIVARGLSIGACVLKTAVCGYTRSIRYKKALAAGGARYDLNGQPCGEVTPEQQQEAADDIRKADEAAKQNRAKAKADGR
ncbi:TPA: ProQ/FINO family protein [Salmonella enterica subsp. diarizonae serovar 60-67:z35:-]